MYGPENGCYLESADVSAESGSLGAESHRRRRPFYISIITGQWSEPIT